MNVTIIGAGNSGLAMAAHLALTGHHVKLWNRSPRTIEKLQLTHIIKCRGKIKGNIKIECVTTNLAEALEGSQIILVTTPANSHKELAQKMSKLLKHDCIILLNPGRTFGALEFYEIFKKEKVKANIQIGETQTIIYTCRKYADDAVDIISMKENVLLSTFDANENQAFIDQLPECLHQYLMPATSMIQTSIGNVGMILHCAPLLLNTGWTEAEDIGYKYYLQGITTSIANFIEKVDQERVEVSRLLGYEVRTTKKWLEMSYHVEGETLFDCIQNNKAYSTIDAPNTMYHRYILEDIPCGLVPLESVGKNLGLKMHHTGLVIDLASALLDIDFREIGRDAHFLSVLSLIKHAED